MIPPVHAASVMTGADTASRDPARSGEGWGGRESRMRGTRHGGPQAPGIEDAEGAILFRLHLRASPEPRHGVPDGGAGRLLRSTEAEGDLAVPDSLRGPRVPLPARRIRDGDSQWAHGPADGVMRGRRHHADGGPEEAGDTPLTPGTRLAIIPQKRNARVSWQGSGRRNHLNWPGGQGCVLLRRECTRRATACQPLGQTRGLTVAADRGARHR